MAYPTGTEWRAVSAVIGAQPIGAAETTARHNIGVRTRAHDHTYGTSELVYLSGVADCAAGDLVVYDPKTGATSRAYAGMRGPVAVAMSACVAGSYGWFAVDGCVPVLCASTALLGPAYMTTTVASVDAAGEEGERVDGLSIQAVASGGYATCKLVRPSANGSDSDASEFKGY